MMGSLRLSSSALAFAIMLIALGAVLALCDETGDAADGVGLSVNAHYRNAEWVATEGRDFFFDGGLKPGQPLTRAAYRATTFSTTPPCTG